MSQEQQQQPSYWKKLKGDKVRSGIPYPGWREIVISGLGGLLVISLIRFVDLSLVKAIIPPIGASAVLVFAAPAAPFSQPRNVIGGHLISATVGVIVAMIFQTTNADGVAVPLITWWTAGLASAGAITLMVATKMIHPPAGATALLPVLSATLLPFSWILSPVLIGCLILVISGILYNNLWAKRKYPSFWI